MGFIPSPQVRRGKQRHSDEHDTGQFKQAPFVCMRPGIKPEADGTYKNAEDHERMKTDETYFEKIFYAHFPPSVVISIPHDKPRKQKEKIHGEITVVHRMIRHDGKICFEQMENHNQDGGCTAESVQYGIVWFHMVHQTVSEDNGMKRELPNIARWKPIGR
jgi:hypothetical protein